MAHGLPEIRRVGPACVYTFEGGEPGFLVFNEVMTHPDR